MRNCFTIFANFSASLIKDFLVDCSINLLFDLEIKLCILPLLPKISKSSLSGLILIILNPASFFNYFLFFSFFNLTSIHGPFSSISIPSL